MSNTITHQNCRTSNIYIYICMHAWGWDEYECDSALLWYSVIQSAHWCLNVVCFTKPCQQSSVFVCCFSFVWFWLLLFLFASLIIKKLVLLVPRDRVVRNPPPLLPPVLAFPSVSIPFVFDFVHRTARCNSFPLNCFGFAPNIFSLLRWPIWFWVFQPSC